MTAPLTEAAEMMRGYMARMGAIAGAHAPAGRLERPAPANPAKDRRSPDREAGPAAPRAALAVLFGPDQDSLQVAPEELADAFQPMLMSAGRPGAPDPLTIQ
ncbi:hypothetical protein [Streptomyces sp. NPDC059349]|uniref:hypothetical protein n=1 Tax=Streptomyces sp. NPDC059349 TaxID=3346808 RepID=UPI00368FEBD1